MKTRNFLSIAFFALVFEDVTSTQKNLLVVGAKMQEFHNKIGEENKFYQHFSQITYF